jgi:hypothetical protein
MIDAAATALLIAATGVAQRSPTCIPGAAFEAVNMASIAPAADQDLDPAALAQEQPRRRLVGFVLAIVARMRTTTPWTQSLPGAIMPLHACSCTV